MNTKSVICRPVSLPLRALSQRCLAIIALYLLCSGTSVSAAESTSYRLYDSFPNAANPAPDRSDSFLFNENGVTWVAEPVASTHFQIVTAPPPVASSSSSASSGAGEGATQSASSRPVAGGHRGHGTTVPSYPIQRPVGGTISILRPPVPEPRRGSALPAESTPAGSESSVIPSVGGVPPHHYRQPVETLRLSTPLRKLGSQWLHYKQRLLSTLSANLIGDGNGTMTWKLSIGMLCVVLQIFVVVFILRRLRRARRHSPRKR